MATRTLGSNATTSLTAIDVLDSHSDADFASIANLILDDMNSAGQIPAPTPPTGANARIFPGAFSRYSHRLIVPNRGVLIIRPGDYVAVDALGWPILIANWAINGGGTSWTHS
jgi:hypothetical protein